MTPFGGAGGLQGRTVWVLANLDWAAPWQPVQETATRLARANQVVFVETTGRRRLRLDDLPRLARRLAPRARTPVPAGALRVVSPRVLPLPRSSRAAQLNAAMLLRALGTAGEPPIIWAYLPSPTLLALVDRVPEAPLVYHCMLDFPALPGAPPDVADVERAVVERAALIVVDSGTLLHDRGWTGARVAHLPSGADVEPFVAARRDRLVAPDVAALQGPVAGFAGSIDHRIDVALVREAAERAPNWTFAFVGPVDRTRRRALRALPNVHLLAARPHRELPAVLSGFDVGLMPYAEWPGRRTTFPAKLFEYFAAGLPVVSTPLPDVEPFAEHVRTVRSGGELANVLAAEPTSTAAPAECEHARERRATLARAHDWEHREAEWGRLLRSAGITEGARPTFSRRSPSAYGGSSVLQGG